MLRIFWGPDNFTRGEALARLKAELDSDDMLSANTTILDGAHLDFEALIAACDTVPFLAEHRLVIVEDLLAQGESRPARRRPARRGAAATDAQPTAIERLAAYAATMPPSTTLLLLEGDIRRDGAALAALSRQGEATHFPRRGGQDLRAWVSERANAAGAALDPAAQALLIESTGGELWLIAQELEKLALYAGGRKVSQDDVRLLVPAAQDANVFVMVDAIVAGRTQTALAQLELLLARGSAGPYLITMIARQYRQLIIAEDLLSHGSAPAAIASAVGMREGTPALSRLLQQARRMDPRALQQQLEAVAEADAAIKRGELDEYSALYGLVTQLLAQATAGDNSRRASEAGRRPGG